MSTRPQRNIAAHLHVQSPHLGPIGPPQLLHRENRTVMRRPENGLDRVATLHAGEGPSLTLEAIAAPLPAALIDEVSRVLAAMDPWHRYGFPAARLASFLAPGPTGQPRYFLIEDDAIAGLVALKLGWMFGTYLNLLAVLPAHQGRGIGSAALSWLDAFGRERQERNQFVVTSAFNARGLALYQRHGFAEIARMPGLIDDTETEILLRKRLA